MVINIIHAGKQKLIQYIDLYIIRFFMCLSILINVTSLSSCGVSSEVSGANVPSSSLNVSNEMVIANVLYSDIRTPDDFYQEVETAGTFGSISHVKNINLLINDGLPDYELTSNDFVEAMDWDEQAAASQVLYDQLVDVSQTDLYFQFTRVNPTFPEILHSSRVFKADILDRFGVDSADEESVFKGRITKVGVTAADVKLIVEYLWMFTFSNNYRNAIVESYTVEGINEFIHTMTQAELNFSYSQSCDTIDLYEVSYTVSKATGNITRDKVLDSTFNAKLTNGVIDICQ